METKEILIVDDGGGLGKVTVLITADGRLAARDVLARARAALERACDDCSTIVHEGLVVNLDCKTVVSDGVRAEFTRTEFDLLSFLLRNKGRIFSRRELVEAVWPENVVVSDRTVDVVMTRIRKKIGPYSANIVARAGFGYMFSA